MEGSYNFLLVTLSCLIAALAAYTALDLAGRFRTSGNVFSARCWLLSGALSMGAGAWAAHFVGMLEFMLPIHAGYDPILTIASLIAVVAASGIALTIANTNRLTGLRIALAGAVMGGGISTMHYVGMAAMKVQPAISYNPTLIVLSVAIAFVASAAALWTTYRFDPVSGAPRAKTEIRQRIGAACIMATAVAGMHYTGMAAAMFPADSHGTQVVSLPPEYLAGIVAAVSIVIMVVILVVSVYDTSIARRTVVLTESLKAANAELQFLLLHDPLTRLPKRLLLEDRIDRIMARAMRNCAEFAVLYIDLDRFKSVNDLLGHHIGDALLKQAAARIQGSIRHMDTVARLDSDEFMIVLNEGEPLDGVRRVAERVGAALSTLFNIEGHEIRISGSIGISVYPQHGRNAQELIAHADAAMYYAKDIGKNTYQVYEEGMSTTLEWRNTVSSRLARAIEQNELTLAYQPKVDTTTGIICGAEALVRWVDNELGVVIPQDFIPIAEDTGLILQLGENVLYQACRQARRWQDSGLQTLASVAVNVSSYQLNHPNFVQTIETVLAETRLEHHRLELEVTESAIMQNPQRAGAILTELHNLGVKISIDDFGTGYSNLVQLKRFPIDYLKIDRSFISGVTTDIQDAELVKTIVALATSLNLGVIAEGVETREQLDFVKALGIGQYQGFLYSKPLPSDDFIHLVTKTSQSSHQSVSSNP